MKKYIGYLVAFIICICWSFIKCTDDRPIGTFVVKPKYDGEIIFTIREDGQVKYEQ